MQAFEAHRPLAEVKGGQIVGASDSSGAYKFEIQCKQGHTFQITPGNLRAGWWCAKCSRKSRVTIDDVRRLALGRGGTCLNDKIVNSKSPLRFQCRNGHVFRVNYNNLMNGSWCRDCTPYRFVRVEDAQDLAQSRGGKCLSTKQISSKSLINWLCKQGHSFVSSYGSVRAGHWCPQCGHFDAASKSRKSEMFKHWHSGEAIVAVGGFERAFLRFFNRHKIPFVWQQFFPMESSLCLGRSFTVDAYLPEIDHFCEVKGTFRSERSYQKWLFFKATFSNSCLLGRDNLEFLGILEPRSNDEKIQRFRDRPVIKWEFYACLRRISLEGQGEPSLMYERCMAKKVDSEGHQIILDRREFLRSTGGQLRRASAQG